MAISSTQIAVRYSGNNSTTTKYPIPFPFHSPEHIYVAVSPDGVAPPVLQPPTAYAVHPAVSGVDPGVTTTTAVPPTAKVTVFRSLPLTQPTVFQPHGPFPAKANETALDRLLMQVQQLNHSVNELRGIENGPDIVDVPTGSGLHEVEVWAGPANRGGVQPRWQGQLGVEIATASIWIAQSVAVGAWTLYAPPAPQLIHSCWVWPPDDGIPYTGERIFHIAPTALSARGVAIASRALDEDTSLDWELTDVEGTIVYASGTLPVGVTQMFIPFTDEIPAGTALRIEVATLGDGYGMLGGRLGLEASLFYVLP